MGEILEREKPVIQVRKLRKEYIMGQEKVVALRDINLTVYKGEICCIFGKHFQNHTSEPKIH